jgi:hypothetical protein
MQNMCMFVNARSQTFISLCVLMYAVYHLFVHLPPDFICRAYVSALREL